MNTNSELLALFLGWFCRSRSPGVIDDLNSPRTSDRTKKSSYLKSVIEGYDGILVANPLVSPNGIESESSQAQSSQPGEAETSQTVEGESNHATAGDREEVSAGAAGDIVSQIQMYYIGQYNELQPRHFVTSTHATARYTVDDIEFLITALLGGMSRDDTIQVELEPVDIDLHSLRTTLIPRTGGPESVRMFALDYHREIFRRVPHVARESFLADDSPPVDSREQTNGEGILLLSFCRVGDAPASSVIASSVSGPTSVRVYRILGEQRLTLVLQIEAASGFRYLQARVSVENSRLYAHEQ